jgi:hypothetical protein
MQGNPGVTMDVQVQEAADCLGVNCQPRYVEVKEVPELRDINWGHWQVSIF